MGKTLRQDWSREEVEATVADYFEMLGKELKGSAYSKTEHRHRLARLLNSRSHGAIERKHQNISAILIELGFPYIAGYKPLRNYQQLLYEIVTERLENNHDIVKLVESHVDQPARLPEIDDILATLISPPAPVDVYHGVEHVHEQPAWFGVNYFAREAHNRSLGLAGEEFVMRFEKARLIAEGQENLASRIEHISVTKGDGPGFDILSFEKTGRERLIEVKTTAYGPMAPFFVTRNELVISDQRDNVYYLYRIFDFRRQVRLFTKRGSLERTFRLAPTEYLARIG